MLAFLPVSRFRVSYQVASGRPYSPLERYLLEAVREGHATLDALVDLFRVHRRIVIEGLVTLMQAGWLGLRPGGDDKFDVTDAGQEALKQPGALPPNIALTEKPAYLVMELVRGQIAPSNAVFYWERRHLKALWEKGIKIPKADAAFTPETGQVRPLLRPQDAKAEYVRAIGPINFDRHNSDYLVVDVDTANRRLVGIPSAWEAELVDELIERVQRREAELIAKGQSVDDQDLRKLVRITRDDEEDMSNPDVWRVAPDALDFVSGIEAHGRLLADCLRRASSCVVISSAILTRTGINDLLADILDAVKRGVLIDVLWGWPPEPAGGQDHAAALKMLLDLEKNTRSMSVPGRLQVSEQPSRSNVGLLVADPDGAFEVTLGCCEWLAGKKGASALSVRLRHAGLVSRLCGLVGDMIATDAHLETSASALQLLNASADLDARALTEEPPPQALEKDSIQARLLLDRQNELVLRAVAANARERLILSSRRWNSGAPEIVTALRQAMEGGCRQASVHYGPVEALPAAAQEARGELEKLGADVKPAAEPCPNYAVVDDHAFVTSRDWLARPRASARPRLCDVGIALRGAGVVERLLASLPQAAMR